MLLYSLSALKASFQEFPSLRTMLNIKEIDLLVFFPPLITPFPLTLFINEEAMGAINKAAKGAIIAERNRPSFFLFCVWLFQWHHQLLDLNLLVTL